MVRRNTRTGGTTWQSLLSTRTKQKDTSIRKFMDIFRTSWQMYLRGAVCKGGFRDSQCQRHADGCCGSAERDADSGVALAGRMLCGRVSLERRYRAERKPQKMINTHWGGVVEDNSFGTHEFLSCAASWAVKPMSTATSEAEPYRKCPNG